MIVFTHKYLDKLSQHETTVFRFFIGMTFSLIIAFGFDWPLAMITPVFVAKFLGSTKPKMPFKALMGLFYIILAAFILGGIFTRLLLPYPVVFLLVLTLVIFWLSYWGNSGGNEFVITMLLIGFTLVPMLALLHQAVAEQATIGFIFSCLLALTISMLMHEIVPDKPEAHQHKLDAVVNTPPLTKAVKVHYSLLTTIMITPVMTFFFYFNLTSTVLVLIFIALMAQKPNLVAGVKGSKALLMGNTLGGLVAIAVYNLLVIMPTFTFLSLMFAVISIIFARLIFSGHKLAPLFAMALGTVIILISASTSGDAAASENFYIRIIQIGAACAYVVFTTILAGPWLKKISQL